MKKLIPKNRWKILIIQKICYRVDFSNKLVYIQQTHELLVVYNDYLPKQ